MAGDKRRNRQRTILQLLRYHKRNHGSCGLLLLGPVHDDQREWGGNGRSASSSIEGWVKLFDSMARLRTLTGARPSPRSTSQSSCILSCPIWAEKTFFARYTINEVKIGHVTTESGRVIDPVGRRADKTGHPSAKSSLTTPLSASSSTIPRGLNASHARPSISEPPWANVHFESNTSALLQYPDSSPSRSSTFSSWSRTLPMSGRTFQRWKRRVTC